MSSRDYSDFSQGAQASDLTIQALAKRLAAERAAQGTQQLHPILNSPQIDPSAMAAADAAVTRSQAESNPNQPPLTYEQMTPDQRSEMFKRVMQKMINQGQ